MSAQKILVITLPTLRLDWVQSEMPRLAALSRDWHRAAIDPVFPALTCPSHATLTTGLDPHGHGIIANGVFDRTTKKPEMWVFPDPLVQGRRVWEDYRAAGRKTGVFFLLNIRDATADAALLPRPIHNDDGSMQMWCWHKPEGLYPRLVKELNHFNLLKFWGPMAGIESSQWIARATARTILDEDLDLSFVYLPHTDYAPQKFGPQSDAFRAAHREIDAVLGDLIESLSEKSPALKIVLVSEYGMTEVHRCLQPNLILRAAGLLAIRNEGGREYVDYGRSKAFAMVDHQIAHVYCSPKEVDRVADNFRSEAAIEEVFTDRAACGLDHPRSGEVILMAKRDSWLWYPWWEDFARAPEFAKTMDIHAKPGYDPLEMFWDAEINGTAQTPALIRGSHGALARDPDQRAALLSNLPGAEAIGSTAQVHRALKAALE